MLLELYSIENPENDMLGEDDIRCNENESVEIIDLHIPKEGNMRYKTLKNERDQFAMEVDSLRDEVHQLRAKVAKVEFNSVFLSHGDKDARTVFYTRLPNYLTFM